MRINRVLNDTNYKLRIIRKPAIEVCINNTWKNAAKKKVISI